MSFKLKFAFGFYLLGMLLLLASLPTTHAQSACEIPASGPWPACATGNKSQTANNCAIPPSGPWPACARNGSAEPANECEIPRTGPWPACATSGEAKAAAAELPAGCVIPESGLWPPCAMDSSTTRLAADNCIIPETGPWPECDLLTVTNDNFWAHQYRVAWRGGNANITLVMSYETITIDQRSGEEERTSNELSVYLGESAGADFLALKPFHGRLFESQYVTFQLHDAADKIIASQVLPLVKPRKIADVHQFEMGGTDDNPRAMWQVSPALDGSRVQVHIVRPPLTPEIINAPLGSEQREEFVDMPLVGALDITGEYDSVELIVNGWVVGTLK